LQSRSTDSRRPIGKLHASRWIRQATLKPHIFPVTIEELTPYNDFSIAMAFSANLLAQGTRHPVVASKLRRLADRLLPGQVVPTYVFPGIEYRPLPQQWKEYEPVWSLVQAILRNQALLNSTGKLSGLQVAVEPWPLLETLLHRVLSTIATQMSDPSSHYVAAPKSKHVVLQLDHTASFIPEKDAEKRKTHLISDGTLLRNGTTVATFEAKYSQFDGTPAESHVYQALTAAAILNSPTCFLIYPGKFDPVHYFVKGFDNRPTKLIAVGMDMYSYTRSAGNVSGAERIMKLL
jgi:hypothetical protein